MVTVVAIRVVDDAATLERVGLPLRDDGWGIVLGYDEDHAKLTGLTEDVAFVRMILATEFAPGDEPMDALPDDRFRWVAGHLV